MAKNIDFKLNVDDRGSSQTLGKMEQKLESLNEEMKQTEVGSQRFKELQQEIQRTNSDLKTFEESMEGVSTEDIASRTGELAGGLGDLTGAFVLATGAGEEFEKSLQKGLSIAIGVRGAIESVTAASKLYGPAVRGAKNATIALNAAMRANPAGAVATAIGLLVAGIGTYIATTQDAKEETSALNRVQDDLADASEKARKSIIKEKTEVDALVSVIEDETASRERKNKAIKKLQEINPEHFGDLDTEKSKLEDVKEAQNEFNKAILREAKVKAIKEKVAKKTKKIIEAENKSITEQQNIFEQGETTARAYINAFTPLNLKMKELNEARSQQNDIIEKAKEEREALLDVLSEEIDLTQDSTDVNQDEEESFKNKREELDNWIEGLRKLKEIRKVLGESPELTKQEELRKKASKELAKSLKEARDTELAGGKLEVDLSNVEIGGKEEAKKEFTTLAEDITNSYAEALGGGFSDTTKSIMIDQVKEIGGQLKSLLDRQFQNRIENIEAEKQRRIEASEEAAESELEIQKQRLEQGQITEEEFRQRKQELDRQQRLKEWQAEVKAFEKKQEIDKQKAIIDGAIGATQTIANVGFPAAFGVLPLVAANVATQIATIESQEPPSRPEFKEGGIVQGPSHQRGGVPINAEGGEIILNRNVGEDPVLRDIASGLNSVSGGREFGNDSSSSSGRPSKERSGPVQAFVVETDITEAQKKAKRRKNRSKL